jgi:hypothetical protein
MTRRVTATFDWAHELFDQFDLQWNLAHGPSQETLTDEEYLSAEVSLLRDLYRTSGGARLA